MSTVFFRQMAWDDIDAVTALEKATFSLPWGREAFESELASNVLARYIIAEADGQIAGYAGMWLILDEAHIMNVAVDSSLRGCGIGKALMRKMITVAAENGAKRMTLEVRRSNAVARTLYQQLGFVECGVRPGYYSDNGEDALLLWLEDLRPDKREV